MSLSRVVIVFFALSPFAFGASKEIMELQRDVAMLQDQVRTLQSALDQKVGSADQPSRSRPWIASTAPIPPWRSCKAASTTP